MPRSPAAARSRSARSRSAPSTSSGRSRPATTTTRPRPPRPFDAGRDGFVMGEGAALLVLEAADVAARAAPSPMPRSWATARRPTRHHMVQPRADGSEAARAATIALDDAGVDPAEIDYVNAHASSTPIGDVAEARAIALALGERAATVPVSGTKALYGHPLGASGAIEAAICALTIRDGWAPASVNLAEADPDVADSLLPGLFTPDATAVMTASSRHRSGSVA